uniref:BEN domain-containing protein n=1 Tax=Rhipicephalus microplus TaxID=6941 RepID=A0A6M2D2A2_RHIMP
MFARSLMRCLWKREELVNRSVTGTVCRRFMYQGAKAKPALSPRKHDAIQMAFYHFVKTHPNTMLSVDKRLRNLNRNIGYFLRGLK